MQRSSTRPLQPNDVVDDTCTTVPFPDFCASTLRSDPKSGSAQSSKDLGVILVDQVDSNAGSTLTKISSLISQAQDPKLKAALSSCQDSYGTIVKGSVPASRAALIGGNPKFAEQYMTDAAAEIDRCDKNFDGLDSPLTSEDDFVHRATTIVAAIAKTLE
ncbi:hypothetical protein MLD38_038790 [Melastoma candidum]|uniref:Uncharacterized protein n=1 Tax=Melastoma candidum TaxID=119954 RepID=A0ACB9L115_9MYRT|nr:hypothetical protein MLD38_038790 [Melastoma candidum]